MDAVLDTNVAISATINPKGPSARLIDRWRARSFQWVTSPPLLEELEHTLAYPRLGKYLASRRPQVNRFLDDLRQNTRLVVPTQQIDVIKRDPPDNRVLEAAVEGRVEYIVSGDNDLLELGQYENIRIITPARFLAILSATGSEK